MSDKLSRDERKIYYYEQAFSKMDTKKTRKSKLAQYGSSESSEEIPGNLEETKEGVLMQKSNWFEQIQGEEIRKNKQCNEYKIKEAQTNQLKEKDDYTTKELKEKTKEMQRALLQKMPVVTKVGRIEDDYRNTKQIVQQLLFSTDAPKDILPNQIGYTQFLKQKSNELKILMNSTCAVLSEYNKCRECLINENK